MNQPKLESREKRVQVAGIKQSPNTDFVSPTAESKRLLLQHLHARHQTTGVKCNGPQQTRAKSQNIAYVCTSYVRHVHQHPRVFRSQDKHTHIHKAQKKRKQTLSVYSLSLALDRCLPEIGSANTSFFLCQPPFALRWSKPCSWCKRCTHQTLYFVSPCKTPTKTTTIRCTKNVMPNSKQLIENAVKTPPP